MGHCSTFDVNGAEPLRRRLLPEWVSPVALGIAGALVTSCLTLACPQAGQPALALLYNRDQGLRSLLEADPEMRILNVIGGGAGVVFDFKRADLGVVSLAGVAAVLRAPPIGGLCHSPVDPPD